MQASRSSYTLIEEINNGHKYFTCLCGAMAPDMS